MQDQHKFVETVQTLIDTLPKQDDQIIDRMIDALMAEFPGIEGYDTVLGQLPHLYGLMLQHAGKI